jgi:RIO kinase 1
MLCAGLIHGDLSEYNVLVSPQGPVIIDLPQAVDAAGNNGALAMLERDVDNVGACLGRFAPELVGTRHAREMWALFESGELRPDSVLTGLFVADETTADVAAVMDAINDARAEAIIRQQGRDAAEAELGGTRAARAPATCPIASRIRHGPKRRDSPCGIDPPYSALPQACPDAHAHWKL